MLCYAMLCNVTAGVRAAAENEEGYHYERYLALSLCILKCEGVPAAF